MTNQLLCKYKAKSGFIYVLIAFFAFIFASNAQSVVVTGTVSDNLGPLPGVSVVVEGTNVGTATDFDGNYSISAPSDGVLQFSFVGFSTQEVPVNGQSVINVTLREDLQQLDEVVVVGYGSMERANVTGAISSISAEEISKVPVPNVVEAMRGQVAGLRVQRATGQPGSGVNFTIRGVNSLGEGMEGVDDANQPIIVVDGVPLVGGNLSELNPADIETVNVIKDAGAGAIYGSSAANGVVLITTKGGKAGRPTVTVNASTGFNDLATRLNMMNGDEYVKYLADSGQGTTLNGLLNPNELDNFINGESVDWQDTLLRKGVVNNVSMSISGGSEKMHFYLNGDMYKEQGIVTKSDYNRYSLRFNADYSPSDFITIGARVQLTKSFADETSNAIEDFPGNTDGSFAPFIPILENTPLGDVYDDEGNLVKLVRDDRFQINPLWRYNESVADRKVTRSYVNPYVEINLFDGFKYTLNTFAEDRNEFTGRFYSSQYRDGDPSEARIQDQNAVTYLVDNILSYKKDFGKHGIDATFVYGFQNYEFEQVEIEADRLGTDLLGYHGIDVSTTDRQTFNWDTDEWGKVYYVGRLSYDYDNRYVATVTMRRDGSSRFAGDNQWGNFPSASLAWNAHSENFWGSDPLFSTLKLRLSYGTLGNDRINTYRYLANPQVVRPTILVVQEDGDDDPTNNPIVEENLVGFSKNTLANPYLKWETSKQANIGLDFGIFNERINGSVDVYETRTTDLLLPEIIPVTNGYTSYINNVGETKNWGIDVSLRARIIETEDFTWSTTINWAKDQNEIVKLARSTVDEEGNPVDDEANGWFIGEDIRAIYNYDYLGVWQTDEATEAALFGAVPGDAKFRDINGDNSITPGEDRIILGSPTPDWYGGITNTFTYKGFELTVLIEAVQGVTTVNSFYGGYSGRNNQIAVNYWTPDNPSNDFPRPGSTDWGGTRGNAVKTQDASFIALRNVSLAYNLPIKFMDNTPFKAISFYLRGNNLKYFTEYEDAYSPEAGRGQYPIMRNFTFGTSITF